MTERSRHVADDPTTYWERGVYWGLILLLLWAPLPFGSNRPWAVSIIVVWVALLGVLWAIGWAAGHCRVRTAFTQGRWPLLLLILWAGLLALQVTPLPAGVVAWLSPGAAASHAAGQAYSGLVTSASPGWLTLSIDAGATRRQLLLALALTGYFGLLLLVIPRTARLRHFCAMVVLSGIVCSALALYLHFTGAAYMLFHEPVLHDHAKGPFMNRNHFGTYVGICLACGVGLIAADFAPVRFTNRKQIVRWVLQLLLSAKARTRLLLIVMVIALILTRSRMGNAAFLTALVAGGLIALVFLHAGWRTLLLFVGSMIILDVAIIGSWIGVDQVLKRVQQTAATVEIRQRESLQEESFEERTDQGLAALAGMRQFAWFGTGAGSFEAMYPRHKPPGYTATLNHAHNDYIQFFVEGGALGVTLLGLLVLWAYRAVLRTMRLSRDASRRGLSLGVLVGMLAAMMHVTVEFSLQIPAVALLFTALLAIGFLAQDRIIEPREGPATA